MLSTVENCQEHKHSGESNANRLLVAGLVLMGLLYAATLILIVNSAISYKQDETLELTFSKAEAVAALVASNTKISDDNYYYLLDLSFNNLLSDPINISFEREMRAAIGDNSVRYVYLISQLPQSRISYRVSSEEAPEYGLESGAPMDYVYLLDAVSSEQQRIEDTDGMGYTDRDRYIAMDEEFDNIYHRRQNDHLIINDRWGNFITGFAPFYTTDGNYIGMIGVDISMESYQASMMRFHMVIGSFILINLMVVFLAVWLIKFAMKSYKVNNQQKLLLDHDALTLTLSRRGIMQALSELCSLSKNGDMKEPAYFFIIDVDHFKEYNDHYGHLMGDKALQKIGVVLRQTAEEYEGVVGRYGGDEFMMILMNINQACIRDIATKLLEEVRALEIEHVSSPVSVYKSVSIGMTTVRPGEPVSPEDLIELTDRALYRAKRNGRDQASA